MNKTKSKIVKINKLKGNNIHMYLQNDYIAKKVYPGQFVNIKCSKSDDLLLRRPISVLNAYDNIYEIIFRVVGEGTKRLSNFLVNEYIDIMGPLGNGFEYNSNYKKIAFIGGGIGTFPVYYAAMKHNCDLKDLYIGFKNKDEIILEDQLKNNCTNLYMATDDGSYGYKGFVTDLFIKQFKKYDMVYICGPSIMEKKIVSYLIKEGISGQVSLEERMACGIGACLVCACKTTHGMKHVCKDGPVFKIDEVFNGDII